jgi:flagellar basal body rod protein FlgF
MENLGRNSIKIIVFMFLMVSCTENNTTKMVIFNENHKNIIEDIILYKNFNIDIIDNGKFWTIKNISEEALLEFVGIARLKLDVIANNIANVNTDNFFRRYVKITAKSGVEVINDTENVDLNKEMLDMIEIQRFYEASIEYLKKINKNIVFM